MPTKERGQLVGVGLGGDEGPPLGPGRFVVRGRFDRAGPDRVGPESALDARTVDDLDALDVAGVDVIEERAVLDREGGVGGLPPEPEVDQKGDDNSAPDPECKLRPDHRPHPRGPGGISVRIGPRRCGVGLWHDGCVVAWGTGLSRAENAAAKPVAS